MLNVYIHVFATVSTPSASIEKKPRFIFRTYYSVDLVDALVLRQIANLVAYAINAKRRVLEIFYGNLANVFVGH